MAYYFNLSEFLSEYDLGHYSYSTQAKRLKDISARHLRSVAEAISKRFSLTKLSPVWISRTTFGAVLIDYWPEKTGPGIIGAHKKLFELVSDDYDYVVLSRNVGRNFISGTVGSLKVLVINVSRYKQFIKVFGNQEKRVKLFLFKLLKEEEDLINGWISSRPSEERRQINLDREDLLEHLSNLNIDSVEAFSEFLRRASNAFESKIVENIIQYQQELDKFREMINDDSIHETKLSKYLHEHIWIMDFKYMYLDENKREFKTEVGNIDIFASKEYLSVNSTIIFELKVPSTQTLKNYRNKPAITAAVGNAISQIINYMEEKKESGRLLSGILILGRKEEDFLKILNQHFTHIKIVTYEELANNCQNVLDAFKQDKSAS